jgi:Fe2+ or Zn2+ uptake regulation protein
MNPEKIINLIRSQGQRITKVREVVVEIFINSSEPVTAQDILLAMESLGMRVNKTTVYRELDFLLKKGIIRAVDFGDGAKRYELMEEGHHHHVICTNCRKVEDVVLEVDLDQEEQKIAQKIGFKIENHALEFFGLCPDCQLKV